MNKVIAGITASSILGLSLLSAVPASATPVSELPPSENISCSVNVISPATPEIPAVPAVEEVPAQWWNFSPNDTKEPFDGPPAFPSDPRGTWQGPHTNGGAQQDVTGTFQNGNGHGSWFHRTPGVEGKPGTPAVPAKDAVTVETCTASPSFPAGNVDITYQCDATFPTRTDTITFTRIDYTYDPTTKTWTSVTTENAPEPFVRFLTAEEVLEHCNPTPGDKPIDNPVDETPTEPVTPVDPPKDPVTPAEPVAPTVPVPTCADLGVTNIAAGTANYFDQNDSDKDGVACEDNSTSPKSDVPAVDAVVPPVPADQSQTSANTPAEQNGEKTLANTGSEGLFTLGIIAVLGILAGLSTKLFKRRTV